MTTQTTTEREEAAERLNGELVEGLRMLVEAAEAAARHHREEASGHEFPALEPGREDTRDGDGN